MSFLALTHSAFAQTQSAARYEIDAKRIGVLPTDKDALPRSREFLRLDSTYYVGWMYEGIYKYDHSADYLGYKNALVPLRKAFYLIDKDFKMAFYSLYYSGEIYNKNVSRYQDLYDIYTALIQCYDNLEMPDSVMVVINKVAGYHFKKDFGFGLYTRRAWTYHRNRFYTSSKFAFLKNSVQENEKMAFQWCYAGLADIAANKAYDDALFGEGQSINEELSVYHYLALLHCYNKNYDSSEYYYQRLIDGGAVSWNNYGGMQSEIGHFANALDYFNKDADKSFINGMLREAYFYMPELYVYAGRTKEAIQMGRTIISENASLPGFGWYSIAMARSFLYDGQLDSAELYLQKAANFKELHIGTTLTQSQYDFTIHLLQVEWYDKKIAQEKFLHKNWWYSPTSLLQVTSLKLQKFLAEYAVVNELIYNPDRERLVYDLFCAESTTTFDEAWFVLKDFSTPYFINKYNKYIKNDKRKSIRRYFELFAAKFSLENGDTKKAYKAFKNMEATVLLDMANEKLFIGRLYESLAIASAKRDDKETMQIARQQLMADYPQLIPFSGIRPSIYLSTSGIKDDQTKKIINELTSCQVDFVKNSSNADAQAEIQFEKKGNAYLATIWVRAATGKVIVQNEQLVIKSTDQAGKELAMRLFGTGGSAVF